MVVNPAAVDAPVGKGKEVAETGCVTPDPSTLTAPLEETAAH
jgi:hypothetical protein